MNYRRFRDLKLDLSAPVTVLIGPNGSGKSNVVDALLFAREVFGGAGVQQAFSTRGGVARVSTVHDVNQSVQVSLFTQAVQGTGMVRAVTGVDLGNSGNPNFNQQMQINPSATAVALPEQGWTAVSTTSDRNYEDLAKRMQRIVHVDPFRNVYNQAQIQGARVPTETGTDLAAILLMHYTNDREGFDEFEALLRQVLPEIDIVETPLVGMQMPTATVTIRFHGDKQKYDLSQLSSGIKDTMVLLTAIHFSEPESLIILEEPENHLHAGAQRAIMQIVAAAAKRESKQFLITTHSDVLVEMAQTEAVYFVSGGEEAGTSELRPVTDLDRGTFANSLGLDPGRLLTSLGMRPQVIVIVEGRNDVDATDPLWEFLGIKDRVLVLNAMGGGHVEIAAAAAALRDGLVRFRLPAKVFVLLDGDGDTVAKQQALAENAFDTLTSHVWQQEEIEDYMLVPAALSKLLTRPQREVEAAINEHKAKRGKNKFSAVLKTLGNQTGDLSFRVIVRAALADETPDLDPEFMAMGNKVLVLSGAPRPQPAF